MLDGNQMYKYEGPRDFPMLNGFANGFRNTEGVAKDIPEKRKAAPPPPPVSDEPLPDDPPIITSRLFDE